LKRKTKAKAKSKARELRHVYVVVLVDEAGNEAPLQALPLRLQPGFFAHPSQEDAQTHTARLNSDSGLPLPPGVFARVAGRFDRSRLPLRQRPTPKRQ